MSRFDVTSFGEGQLRYSVTPGHRLETTTRFDVNVTGTEANVTGLLARLGWHCGWVSALPDSPLGRRVAQELRVAGVDLSAVVWSEGTRLATYYVEYAVPPRAPQVFFDRANTAYTNLTRDQLDWRYLLDTKLLHLSGINPPLSASVHDILVEAVRRARSARVPVSFDMQYRRRLWTPQQARDVCLPILKNVDILFCSRGDARMLFDIEGSPESIVQQLADITSAGLIVTSLSGEGLIGWDRRSNVSVHERARPVVILDRIGAGDAMVAGVLHGWLQGDFAKGLRYGALTAALALSQYGDQVVTTRAEVESLLDSGASDIIR